jgi:uncharacterized protein (TIGR03437 family)
LAHGQTQQYTIANFAGNRTNGYSGDGSAATAAQLGPTVGLAFTNGTLYIADPGNQVVRSVSSTGTISNFAGTNRRDFFGENVAATTARLSGPTNVAVGNSGQVYISDTDNNTIRVVAGGNINNFAGDRNRIQNYGGDGTAALTAYISGPLGIAVNASGVVYFCDSLNHRIRRVTTDGVITTFAGNGLGDYLGDGGAATDAAINHPNGVTVDAKGNLFIADTYNNRIRKVDTNGIITTVAGTGDAGFSGDGGQATAAMLNHPESVIVDAAGNLYISDTFNHRIRMVTSNGIINTIAGRGRPAYGGDGGLATDASLSFPRGLALDPSSSKIYVADSQNFVIRVLTPLGAQPANAPAITSVNSATEFGAFSAIAPGTWVEIKGTNLGLTTRTWLASDFSGTSAPTSLDGTTVTIGGKPAFLSYVSPTQVNVQVPSDVAVGTAIITITTAAGSSIPRSVDVNTTKPGFWLPAFLKQNGTQFPGAFAQDGTLIAPAGSVAGRTTRPAKPGEVITFYGIGFGTVTPATSAGQIVTAQNTLDNAFDISFANTDGEVLYQGLAPNYVGLYQFNVRVPSTTPDAGALPMWFRVNGALQQTFYLPVKR